MARAFHIKKSWCDPTKKAIRDGVGVFLPEKKGQSNQFHSQDRGLGKSQNRQKQHLGMQSMG